MDTPVIVAIIGGWATIIGGLIDVKSRVNGNMTKQFDYLKDSISDVKLDVLGLKTDIRDLKYGRGTSD